MNLLHICCNFTTTRAFESLFGALADLGIVQRVYVPMKSASYAGKNDPHRDDLPIAYRAVVRPWDRFLYHTKARRAVPDLLSVAPPDADTLVHAHTLFTDGGIAYRLHQRQGTPYVVSVRRTDVEFFFRYMPHLTGHAMRILAAARRIIFISPAHRDAVFSRFVPVALRDTLLLKSAVIPNGIAPSWLDGSPKRWRSGDSLHIAFAGRLERNKRPGQCVEAAQALQALLPDSRVTLHLAGDGPLEAALKMLPQVKDGSVILHGRINGQDQLKAFYDACHLFLLPSLSETFGLVYLEAMSRGLPVLYTHGQGFDGQFPEGEVGYAVDPKDPQAIAQAMQQALDGYDQRSERCIRQAATLPWPHVAQRWLNLYQA